MKLVIKSIRNNKASKHKIDGTIERAHKPKKPLENCIICKGRDEFHTFKYPVDKDCF